MAQRTLKIAYFSCPPSGNAGDTVITAATKQIFERFHGPIRWVEMDFRKKTSLLDVLTCRRSDAVLIGGGGLFLKDTNPNTVSGWQWKIPIWKLKLLKKPLIMYALGYNRFRGQGDFDDIFNKHVQACLDTAQFVGLREIGSIKAIEDHLGYYPYLASGIHLTPCPSIFYETKQKLPRIKGRIAVNMAFDRDYLRFGNDKFKILDDITKAVHKLRLSGYEVIYVSHTVNEWDGVNLSRFNAEEIVNFYQTFEYVIGMRSHSQLIPFGQGCRIISLISHDKLKWFLETVGLEHLGIEVTDPDLSKKVVDLVNDWKPNWDAGLAQRREKLWHNVKKNHKDLSEILQ